ncbi:MAG: translocation/assembly module TamB domain-containing protein [Limnochordaceae bacterium]|nr:translocation/assembly module TamB domain-containing protein [Limnochordaceae bacterium]
MTVIAMQRAHVSSGTRRTRGWWLLVALAAFVASSLAAGAWALPAINRRLSMAVARAIEASAGGNDQTVRVGSVSLTFPPGVRVAPVQIVMDEQARLFAPGIKVGVDLPAIVAHYAHPERAIRRLEASQVLVRTSARAPDPPAAAQEAGKEPDKKAAPPSVSEMVKSARDAVLQAMQWVQANRSQLEWMKPGDALSWSLEGTWEELGVPGTGATSRTRWQTRGQLRRAADGALSAEGTVTLGDVEAIFSASVSDDRVDVQRLAARSKGLRLSAQAAVALARDGTLNLALDGAVETDASAELPALRGSFTAKGPWLAQGLPPVAVRLEATGKAPAAAERVWPQHLIGAVASFTVVQQPRAVQIADGRLSKGNVQGRFSGQVSGAWPFTTVIPFELTGLTPMDDVPWWPAYRVSSVDARGEVTGSASGPWRVSGEVHTPSGRLLDVAAGSAALSVEANMSEGRLSVEPATVEMGSGLLTISSKVWWGPSAPAAAGAAFQDAQVVLDLSGTLEGVASTEAVTAVSAMLRPSGAPEGEPAGGSRPPAPRGQLTGSFETRLVWTLSGAQPQPIVALARFDGPDGTVEMARTGPDAYAVTGDLIDLGGVALRPWLRGVRGQAAFSGRLQGGVLTGQLSARHLAAFDRQLGDVAVPLRADLGASRWVVTGARIKGGELEGSLSADVDMQKWSGQVQLRLAQAAGVPPGASAAGRLVMLPEGLRLQDLRIDVQGQEVARAAGLVPVPWPGVASRPTNLDVQVTMQRFPLELVREWMPQWEIQGGGLTGQLAITGRLDAPDARGGLRFQAQRVASSDGRLTALEDVAVALGIQGRSIRVETGQARLATGGSLTLSGSAGLASIWPVALDPVDLRLLVRQASIGGRPVESLELSGLFDGELRWSGVLSPERWPTLSGKLAVRRGRFLVWAGGSPFAGAPGQPSPAGPAPKVGPVPSRQPPEAPAATEGRPSFSAGIPLDVTLEAVEPVRLDVPALGGSGLAQGTLLLTGTTAAPALEGTVQLSQARLRYFGREFRITSGTLNFSKSRGMVPELNLEASTTGQDGGPVQIDVQGEASDVSKLKLSSRPEMTREQLIALLLPPPSDGPGEQWVNRVNEQLAVWAMNPLERAVRESLGLDELWIIPAGGDRGLWLSLGKYLAPSRVYVRYGRALLGSGSDQEVDLSFQLSPNLTWRAAWAESGGLRLGLHWQLSF